jgi:hypothetical protein
MRARSLGALVAALLIGPVMLVVLLAGYVATESHASCATTPLSAPAGASQTALGEIPAYLLPIYVGAAQRYGLGGDGWAWLASINKQETDFGRDLSTSSAGAIGSMQFMPETWARYGVDADGDGHADPYAPVDAIYAAARYLRASGAPGNWTAAVYAYNHASWYVSEVAARAASYLAEPRAVTVGAEATKPGREDPPAPAESTTLAEGANAGGAGTTITGRGTIFDAATAGIELRDAATVGGYWRVTYPNGHTVVLQQLAAGPAAAGGRAPVLASDPAALREAGYAALSDYPGDATVSATYLGVDPNGNPATPGARCSSETPSGGGAVRHIEEAADELAAMRVPYNYGGGHVTPARPTGGQEGSYPGLDCSSAISWVLQHAGFQIPTMVSGEFAHWGDPGPGEHVVIYANAGHVFMAVRATPSSVWRYFGTSGFGHPGAPNGTGPAWFTVGPSAEYLAGFVARHPTGL